MAKKNREYLRLSSVSPLRTASVLPLRVTKKPQQAD